MQEFSFRGIAPTNLNEANQHGEYRLSGTYTNAPINSDLYGILIVYESRGSTWTPSEEASSGASWIWQEIRTTNGAIYVRHAVNLSTSWSIWKQIEKEELDWKTATLAANISEGSGLGGTKGIKYKKVGNHVYVKGSIKCTWDGTNSLLLTTLPSDYRPTGYNLYFFQPLGGNNIARTYISSAGQIYLEWIKALSDGSSKTSENAWVEINMDFFTDLT